MSRVSGSIRYLTAGAFPFHALCGGDQRLAVGLATGLLQRLVDQMHAVPAADREYIGAAVELGPVCLHERLVHRRLVLPSVVKHGSDTDRAVTHAPECVVVHRYFTLAEDLARGNATLLHCLGHRRGLRPAGDENEDGLRIEILRALHEGREVGAGDRHAHRADDFAAGIFESFDEPGFGVDSGAVVRDHGVDLA